MLRCFSLSAAVILLLSSGAFAAIEQTEDFSIGAFNMVKRVGGAGWAEGGNMVIVGHGQEAYAVGTAAIQNEMGILTQTASAVGVGGATTVVQKASIDGLQGQFVDSGRHGRREQEQSLTVGLDNIVRKAGGIGAAVGAQGFVGAQEQSEVTPRGTSTGSQVVYAAQFAAVAGGPCSNVVVKNSLDVTMGQSQIVTGHYLPRPCPPPCDP